MRTKLHLAGIVCIASLAFSMSLSGQTMPRKSTPSSATPSASASPVASPAKQAARSIPFHGMISAVDQNANTFTITGKKQSRVFKVTGKTANTKGGNTASMKDITENEEASGSYWKNADGTLEAKMVRLGPMGKLKREEGCSFSCGFSETLVQTHDRRLTLRQKVDRAVPARC